MHLDEQQVREQVAGLSEEERAYIAGILDGDGSVQIRRLLRSAGEVFVPVIRVDSANQTLIQWLRTRTGLGSTCQRKGPDPVRHRRSYGWAVTGFAAVVLLEAVVAHLRLKHEQAAFVLALGRQCGPRTGRKVLTGAQRALGALLFARVRTLNRVGLDGRRFERIRTGHGESSSHAARVQQGRGKQLRALTPPEYAYLAGLIDAEGRIGASRAVDRRDAEPRTRYRMRLDIGLVDARMAEWLEEATGLGRTLSHGRRGNSRRVWVWTVWERQLEQILRAVRPHLRIKHAQADLALEALELRSSTPHRGRARRWVGSQNAAMESLVHRLADANRRGIALPA